RLPDFSHFCAPVVSCARLLCIYHSFPTRRSSDLPDVHIWSERPAASGVEDDTGAIRRPDGERIDRSIDCQARVDPVLQIGDPQVDRKSTRLNSSHEWISYAVFCLKKKTAQTKKTTRLTSEIILVNPSHRVEIGRIPRVTGLRASEFAMCMKLAIDALSITETTRRV